MSLPAHLEEAVSTLKNAAARIEQVRGKPASLEGQQEWLAALTEYAKALCDIHEYNNESVHEKLHELASRMGLRHFPGAGPTTP